MQLYRLEFFELAEQTRKMRYVHRDFANDLTIDDDYLAIQSTTIEIGATTKVVAGNLIRILRNDEDYFFGLVTNVDPGEYTTRVTFKPFVAIFDTDILFNIGTQYWSAAAPGSSLERTLEFYIKSYFYNNEDTLQNYPLDVSVVSGSVTPWNMYIRTDDDTSVWALVGLYSTLIVRALKEYGVVLTISPDFNSGVISVTIGKVSGLRRIDADLDNVTVKTLKVTDRPDGVNKLVVYNGANYDEDPVIFYVHPDRDWDKSDSDRITPVCYAIKVVTPNDGESFDDAAEIAAYEDLNGAQWDNLIELEMAPNDPLIKPASYKIGQTVTVYSKGTAYTSILTGKSVSLEVVTLIFGSERITYTKKIR